MRARRLMNTVAVAAFLAVLATGLAVSEDAPGPPPNEPSNHAAPGGAEPPSVTVLENHEVEGILGRQVLSAAEENMGRIVDVIVDHSGCVRRSSISAVFSGSVAAKSPWIGTPCTFRHRASLMPKSALILRAIR